MKILILILLLLLAGCAMTPEQRDFLGASAYVIGANADQYYRNQSALNAYWRDRMYQTQMLYEMQRMNNSLEMRRFR